ncbi:MAG TPA: hypothetical protein VJX67_18465, partial [Blastocatellia bacterium]|nr:hypothetical protein [Blastocatellia bacterium]
GNMKRYLWQAVLFMSVLSVLAVVAPSAAGRRIANAEPGARRAVQPRSAASAPSAAVGVLGLANQTGQTVCIQDNVTGNFITFDSGTGAYTFTTCTPPLLTLTGTGVISRVSGRIILVDVKPTQRVTAAFYTNQLTGKASVSIITSGTSRTFGITDTNPRSTCVCASKAGTIH